MFSKSLPFWHIFGKQYRRELCTITKNDSSKANDVFPLNAVLAVRGCMQLTLKMDKATVVSVSSSAQ